jgi:hypothetical protein
VRHVRGRRGMSPIASGSLSAIGPTKSGTVSDFKGAAQREGSAGAESRDFVSASGRPKLLGEPETDPRKRHSPPAVRNGRTEL